MKRALLCLAYTIGVRKGVVDERLNVAQINIGRAPSMQHGLLAVLTPIASFVGAPRN